MLSARRSDGSTAQGYESRSEGWRVAFYAPRLSAFDSPSPTSYVSARDREHAESIIGIWLSDSPEPDVETLKGGE